MREHGPGRPLVFSHIPKTAGTSLRVALEQSLRPEVVVVGLDRALFGGYDDYEQVDQRARGMLYLAPEELPADAALVAGHISPHTTMARYPEADHITVLRSPQLRVISQFLHTRSTTELQLRHWGTAGNALRAGWLPLRDYLDHRMIAPTVDNTITRFLTWPHPLLDQAAFIDEAHDDELLAAALRRLDAFGYVNVAENDGFFDELSAWLGRELQPVRLNERTSVPRWRRPDLARELDAPTRDLLEHRTRIDVRVWEHVAHRVLPGVDVLALLRANMEETVARYAAMLQEPDDARPLRRVVERLYEVRVLLDPRRRAVRPDR